MSNTQILIIGCGWLGKALARSLSSKGIKVVCTTRSEKSKNQLLSQGLQAFKYELGQDFTSIDLKQIDTVVIAVPPSKDEGYLNHLRQSIIQLANKRIIFASSTSYYPKTGSFNEESTFSNPANPKVLEAEQVLSSNVNNALILRFGGLYNTSDRHPGKWMKNKSEMPDGYANMIPQEDAVGAIEYFIVDEPATQGCFNVVSPVKIKKSEFYALACSDFGVKVPLFIPTSESKWIASEKILKAGYSFKVKHPIDYFK